MPLTGGAADKYGNRYEGRWTVRCFIELLEGQASRIRLEPPGELGDGAEFILHRPPLREYHQVKRQRASQYAWNLPELNGTKVLANFRDRLLGTTSDGDEICVFVSGHSAHPLDELAERARRAANASEFVKYFSQGPHLTALLKYWEGLAAQEAWSALKRIYVQTIGEELLKQWNAERVSVLVEGHPDTVTDILAQYAVENVHEELDGDIIFAHLADRGHLRRQWTQGGAAAAIAHSAATFVATAHRKAVAGRTLVRPEAQSVCMKLDGGARQVVIAGSKGAGKSGVAAQVVADRVDGGWKVLVLRANAFEEGMDPAAVGGELGLSASPTSALAGVAGEHKGLLVIDQLDHVALSGSAHHFFECVRVIVESAAVHDNLAVVLACRSGDIQDDPRIRELVGEDRRSRVDVGLLAPDTVLDVLAHVGLDRDPLYQDQHDLLRLPLNLQFFTQALGHPDLMSFASPDDLIACFNDQMRQRYG